MHKYKNIHILFKKLALKVKLIFIVNVLTLQNANLKSNFIENLTKIEIKKIEWTSNTSKRIWNNQKGYGKCHNQYFEYAGYIVIKVERGGYNFDLFTLT